MCDLRHWSRPAAATASGQVLEPGLTQVPPELLADVLPPLAARQMQRMVLSRAAVVAVVAAVAFQVLGQRD